MSVVFSKKKLALEKRLRRFFFSETINRKSFQSFLNTLIEQVDYDVFIFGGLIRDINILGVRDFYSDIDVVVGCKRYDLERFLIFQSGLPYTKNKFGGFRVHFFPWDLDIWCIEDTWAFNNNFVTYTNPRDLLNTTLLNWDAILFNLRTCKIACHDNYFKDMSDGLLKIVLSENPNELGALVRVFRAIRSKYVTSIDISVIDFISSKLKLYSANDIIEYEKKSYHKKFLKINDIEKIYSCMHAGDFIGDISFLSGHQLMLNFD